MQSTIGNMRHPGHRDDDVGGIAAFSMLLPPHLSPDIKTE
jgi:hypothetical protein